MIQIANSTHYDWSYEADEDSWKIITILNR